MACLYQEAETAKAQFAALNGHWDSDVWASKYLYDTYERWTRDESPYPARSLLDTALRDGNARRVRHLIDTGVDVNAGDSQRGRTPLDYAIEEGFDDIAAYLREHGATE